MRTAVVAAGLLFLLAACSDEDPTVPEALHPSTSLAKGPLPGSSRYVITTYYWAAGGWVQHAMWNDPSDGADAQIWTAANNGGPDYPAALFTLDDLYAYGDTGFPAPLVDDFEDGVFADFWQSPDIAGHHCATLPVGGTGCEQGGVVAIEIPAGERSPGRGKWFGLTSQIPLHAEYDVRVSFTTEAGFHDPPYNAFVVLTPGYEDQHHATIELQKGAYVSAYNHWGGGPNVRYRMTETDDTEGRLRVTRTYVEDPGRVVEQVSGSGSFRVYTQENDWRTFSFTARRHANGVVDGQWQRVRRRDGNASGLTSHGVITCFVIEGDEAWLGGYATHGAYSEPPYNYVAWRVRDAGRGARAPADQVSLQSVGRSGSAGYCANTPENVELFDIEAGNVRIER